MDRQEEKDMGGPLEFNFGSENGDKLSNGGGAVGQEMGRAARQREEDATNQPQPEQLVQTCNS